MTKSVISVSPLAAADHEGWLRLWDANNRGVRNNDVTTVTWERLLDTHYPLYGLGARVDGVLAGLVHAVLHPVTGHIFPVCYMQDLFVDPVYRRRGVARALVRELAKRGKAEKWVRIYWLAEGANKEAQSFYRDLGLKLDFNLYVMPLSA